MNLTVSTMSQIPIYEQIKQQIKEQIFGGKISQGEQLPSIRFLAKELKVGVITCKRAYEDLCAEGVLVSHPGKGFFVAALDRESVRQNHMQIITEQLSDTLELAKQFGITQREIHDIIDIIYEEEK
jgi:GntR family transcriptional regulator